MAHVLRHLSQGPRRLDVRDVLDQADARPDRPAGT